jgi:plastocyanin
MTIRRRVAAAVVAVAVASTLAFGVSGAAAGVGATVKVTNYKFKDRKVKVRKGQKVVWKFAKGKHNVVGRNFASEVKRKGKYSHKFKKKGTFKYRCTLHSGMKGKVKVK